MAASRRAVDAHGTQPVATVTGAMLLALLCVGWLSFFIHHISRAISVNYVVDRIAGETEDVIGELMPHPHHSAHLTEDPDLPKSGPNVAGAGVHSGYIHFVDIRGRVAVAKSACVRVAVQGRVGHFVAAGVPLQIADIALRASPRRCTPSRCCQAIEVH